MSLAFVDDRAPARLAWDRSRYPQAWLLAGWPEAKVQIAALAALVQLGVWVHAVDAGNRNLAGRARAALGRAGINPAVALAGRSSTAAGFPDLAGIAPDGSPLFIEMKRPEHLVVSLRTGKLIQEHAAGEPTDDQVEFLTQAFRRGARAGVAWSVQDALAIAVGPRSLL